MKDAVNAALSGAELDRLEPVLERLGRGGTLPHWYDELRSDGRLPNLDGKTIGSVLEMLFVAVLETQILTGDGVPPLRVNPARGVDLPDLDLGVKSPSENYCTSEPFFSAYERVIGSDYDIVVLLTDYQTAKNTPPLRLQILSAAYLTSSQVADKSLCKIMLSQRDALLEESETWTKKVLRFLCYINQSDWRAKRLLELVAVLDSDEKILSGIGQAETDFSRLNARYEREDKEPLPDSELQSIKAIADVRPLQLGVVDAVDDWVIETHQDFARFPNQNEWNRFLESPLDGQIGMSFALQWRYNFRQLFN